MATAEEYAKMSDSEKKKEDWMNAKWRPMMGWSYMLTCIADFVIFPILWSVAQAIGGGEVKVQWQPITLMGAGLYHVAMGAILGIAAYGRTQEKMAGANNGGIQLPGGPTAPGLPQTTNYSAPTSSTGISSAGSSFGGVPKRTEPRFAEPEPATIILINGKPAPAPQPQPEI